MNYNHSKVILLVEDNLSDVDLTKRALDKCSIASELVVAADGEEALDYLLGTGSHAGRDAADQPALTLLDLNIPKVTGLEVLRQIRGDARTRRLPIVILNVVEGGVRRGQRLRPGRQQLRRETSRLYGVSGGSRAAWVVLAGCERTAASGQ